MHFESFKSHFDNANIIKRRHNTRQCSYKHRFGSHSCYKVSYKSKHRTRMCMCFRVSCRMMHPSAPATLSARSRQYAYTMYFFLLSLRIPNLCVSRCELCIRAWQVASSSIHNWLVYELPFKWIDYYH